MSFSAKEVSNTVFGGFKTFVLRGNAIDLAVGVVIGAAFTAFVNSIVKGILTPFIGVLVKTPDFSNLKITVDGSAFLYGDVINTLISFILVAITIYFFVILPMNAMTGKLKKTEPTTKKCPECKSTIACDATRCAFCGIKLEEGAPATV